MLHCPALLLSGAASEVHTVHLRHAGGMWAGSAMHDGRGHQVDGGVMVGGCGGCGLHG